MPNDDTYVFAYVSSLQYAHDAECIVVLYTEIPLRVEPEYTMIDPLSRSFSTQNAGIYRAPSTSTIHIHAEAEIHHAPSDFVAPLHGPRTHHAFSTSTIPLHAKPEYTCSVYFHGLSPRRPEHAKLSASTIPLYVEA